MIITRSAIETLTRAAITKEGRWLQVKKINCSADSISPKVRGNIGTQKKSTSRLQNVTVLALSNPILGMGPRTGKLRQGALRSKEGAKGLGKVFFTIIRPKGLDRGGELGTNHGNKRAIVRQELTAMMHKI